MKKRERQFQTIGVRMRDFGRGIMRHYVPQQQFPAQRETTPPNWQAETETPLLWEESVLPAPEAAPTDTTAPPVIPREATPTPASQSTPATPEKPLQRTATAPPAPANTSKLPASLLKLFEEGRKRDIQREEVRQEKLAKFSEKVANADPETAQQIRRRRGKMSVSYVDTKPLSQGEEPPIQRQSDAPLPRVEPDGAESNDDLSATNAESTIETGDGAQPTDTLSEAVVDTPVVDSLQRSTSAAENVLPAFLPPDVNPAAPGEEGQHSGSSAHQTQDTPLVDSVERSPNEAQPPQPVFLPPAGTVSTDASTGIPVEVPSAPDLNVQREAAPLSTPIPAPVQPIPGDRPTVPGITVPPMPAPTAAPSAPTVEARAAQPPVEHQASEPSPAPRLVEPTAPHTPELPPVPSLPSVPSVSTSDAVQRALPIEVEPPTQPDIVLPANAEPLQRDPINPSVNNPPIVPPAPLPTDLPAPTGAPLALQRALSPESASSNQPTQIPAAPTSPMSSEALVQRETLAPVEVSAAPPPETTSPTVPLAPETNPLPQSSTLSADTLVEQAESATISVQRTPLPDSEVFVPITEPDTQLPIQPVSSQPETIKPAVSGSPSAGLVQRDSAREPSVQPVISPDEPATPSMVSTVEPPQPLPISSAASTGIDAPLAQREYSDPAQRPDGASPELKPNTPAPPVPETLHSDQPSGLPTGSAATPTPNPVQRELDAAPPQTTPEQSALEALPPAQPPIDYPSGLPTVSAATPTPNPVQHEWDVAPPQSTPAQSTLEAVPPAQPPIDYPSGAPTVSAATSTPSPVQRELDAAPPQTTPPQSTLETLPPAQSPIDQPSGAPTVSAATSTPSAVQRELDAAPPQTTPEQSALEALPPAQSPIDQPRLHTAASEVSVQREPAPEPEPIETNGEVPIPSMLTDAPPTAQPTRSESSPTSSEALVKRELSESPTDSNATIVPANTVTSVPLPTAPEVQARSPQVAASPDVPNPPVQRASAATEAQPTVEFPETASAASTASPALQPVNELPALPVNDSPGALSVQRDLITQPDSSTPVTAAQTIMPSAAPAPEPPIATVIPAPPDAVAQRSVQLEQEDQSDVELVPPTATAAPPQREGVQAPIVAVPTTTESSSLRPAVQPTQPALTVSNSQGVVQREAAPVDSALQTELTSSGVAAAPEVSATAPSPEGNMPAVSTTPNELTIQRAPVNPTEAPSAPNTTANKGEIRETPESAGTIAPNMAVTESLRPEISSPASVLPSSNAAAPIASISPTPDIAPIVTSIQRDAAAVATPADTVTPLVAVTEDEVAAPPPAELTQPIVSLPPSDLTEQRVPQSADPLGTTSSPVNTDSALPIMSGMQPGTAVQRDPAPPTASQTPSPVNASVELHDKAEPSAATEQSQPITVSAGSTTLVPETLDRAEAAEAAVGESSSNAQPVDVFAALQAAGMVSRSFASTPADSAPSEASSVAPSGGESEADDGPVNSEAAPSQPPIDVLRALQALGLVPSAPASADTRAPAAIQRSPQSNTSSNAAPTPVIQQEPLSPVLERVITASDDANPDDSETEFELDELEIDQLARDVYRILKDRLRIESERARRR